MSSSPLLFRKSASIFQHLRAIFVAVVVVVAGGNGVLAARVEEEQQQHGVRFLVYDNPTAWRILPSSNDTHLIASGIASPSNNTTSTVGWMGSVPESVRSQTEALESFSVVLSGSLAVGDFSTDVVSFQCTNVNGSAVVTSFLWIDDHLFCDESGSIPINITTQMLSSSNARPTVELRLVVMVHQQHKIQQQGEDDPWDTSVQYCFDSKGPSCIELPTQFALPTIPPRSDQERRLHLQEQTKVGWGTWLHDSMLAHVVLPSAVTVRLALASKDNTNGQHPHKASHVECDGTVRPGMHALDHSYTSISVQIGPKEQPYWIQVESATVSTGPNEQDLIILITHKGPDWNDYPEHDRQRKKAAKATVYIGLQYAWYGTGTTGMIMDSDTARIMCLQAQPSGHQQSPIRFYTTNSMYPSAYNYSTLFGATENGVVVEVDLPGRVPVLGMSTGVRTLHEMRNLVEQAKQNTIAALDADTFDMSTDQREGWLAMQSALGWNVIYNPLELGPVVPVSRGWGFHDGYVLFEWDNLLASYMLSGMHSQAGAKALAYSNLIQTIKSRTTDGFVPNFSAGSHKSRDRTEPPLGSQILERIYKEHGDEWLVRLLFEDLLAWSNWFWAKRRLDPLGLIALGSDPYVFGREFHVDDMQAARYESGQDNSPMYDGDLYCPKQHKMLLYDVGMTSLFIAEARSLSRLARLIKRGKDATVLEQRASEMSELLLQHLWDEDQGIFANRFQQNASEISSVHSPTSFFPLLMGNVSDKTVDRMVTHHLLNATRFCVVDSLEDETFGTASGCRYGVPAAPFDHPAFTDQNYWRGRVWGPLNTILYWALEPYDHVPSARKARQLLSERSLALMLVPWRAFGHIHENYNPITAQGCDSRNSDPFYHWGALNAYISMLEHRRLRVSRQKATLLQPQ